MKESVTVPAVPAAAASGAANIGNAAAANHQLKLSNPASGDAGATDTASSAASGPPPKRPYRCPIDTDRAAASAGALILWMRPAGGHPA
jgi:hypothetical protein